MKSLRIPQNPILLVFLIFLGIAVFSFIFKSVINEGFKAPKPVKRQGSINAEQARQVGKRMGR